MIQTLSIQNLTVHPSDSDGHPALVDHLSLELKRGRILALVGASGSGKSLTCSASLGVAPAGVTVTNGTLALDGQPALPADLRGKTVATILQNPRSAFNPVRTMRHHVIETLKAAGRLSPDNDLQQALAFMHDVGLEEPQRILDMHAFEMSGGMLQRMMIALALMSGAPFLFADEPTTDLDLIVQMQVLDLIERVARQQGLGVLLVTHDMGVVARLADDVAVIDHGKLVETGSVMDIFHAPQHPVTRMLVRAHLSLYGLELAQ
ncbi:nickel import ATP-binding protein NikD [Agrobacterium vitis]|uniref:Nickel import ATP-binding protein NikD n=1 Tax=Agrobacterium vitis TaxID=373 RepID=A0AAE2R9Y7_AGRVI|nr:nickel import ATP-binding protein NikD [Agrobacterium vitis]MBF2714433.1 nickel import ATP-binding protein NikD [Agrobacterium vitis]